jgi:hypothetical protein
MSHFTRIASGIDVGPAMAQIDANPQLWNTYDNRRSGESPHRESSDMWLRYRDPALLKTAADFRYEHESVFYPAWRTLTALHPIAETITGILNPTRIGGFLMTRIPPGCQVYPHHDRGSWHAEYYDMKVWIPLRANDRCINWVEDEAMVWEPGTAWHHDNLKTHAVENWGDTERVCLILCFRSRDVAGSPRTPLY